MMVKVWQEEVSIPTYEIGEAEKKPMFLEKRVYQGSSGVVYPYPVVEKISDISVLKKYNAVYLENEYIKVMILPELGGRVQMAFDKLKGRHFIYYNQVIKPALVGLTGPWISGGIEINWPQHHRPSTFLPVDFTTEQLEDGGATVWVNERERMFHQKGMAGFTLRPGKAFLEISGHLYNPTPVPQTFLWWANPAVSVNDDYQSVFPPDVNAVYDHGRRDVSTFPIATGTYYKVDYSAGVDISRYKNIPVPTSYMAVKSKYDFVGGYEHDSRAGVIHVANHNISPGKKQWTWGSGDFGKAWDRNLTDEDGPYIELMTGMYCDNQPDFAWLQPYEEKTFQQYFIPYRELGIIKNACCDVLMNFEQNGRYAVLKLFATSKQEIQIIIKSNDIDIYCETVSVSPENIFERDIDIVGELSEIKVIINKLDGELLLSWQAEKNTSKEIPSAAKPALLPKEIKSVEQLFLTGHHIEQYRHATYIASDYYQEALRREPTDVRNNNALGLWFFKKGKFQEAEKYLRCAVETQLERNSNPYDGEPLYNLGLVLTFMGNYDEAYEYFYKSCWNGAWQSGGYFALARISVMKNELKRALQELDMSLSRGWHNLLARHLKCAVLRKLGKNDEAQKLISDSLNLDKFNTGCLYENHLILNSNDSLKAFTDIMRNESHNYEELALDYLNAGLYDECRGVLELAIRQCEMASPMVYYYLGYSNLLSGNRNSALEFFKLAAACLPDYCFPNRLESILALQKAIEINPGDSKAYYYLGNIWYDKRQYIDAIECWEKSVEIDPFFTTALRNLAIAYFNKKGLQDEALQLLEKAFEIDCKDSRLFMELDQLYKRLNYPHSVRLSKMEKNQELVFQRDDLYIEYCTLLNQLERFEDAKSLIDSRKFHPWEGGEGKVSEQYQIARLELANKANKSGNYDEAIDYIKQCFYYPENLGEGKLAGVKDNDLNYLLGCIYLSKGDVLTANDYYKLASEGVFELSDAIYYNDQKPDKLFYKGLSLLKIGKDSEAGAIFERFIDYGHKHLNDEVSIDYFAVSLPDLLIWECDLNQRNKVHCMYMLGLGFLGLNDYKNAAKYFNDAYLLDNNHQGLQSHLKQLKDEYLRI